MHVAPELAKHARKAELDLHASAEVAGDLDVVVSVELVCEVPHETAVAYGQREGSQKRELGSLERRTIHILRMYLSIRAGGRQHHFCRGDAAAVVVSCALRSSVGQIADHLQEGEDRNACALGAEDLLEELREHHGWATAHSAAALVVREAVAEAVLHFASSGSSADLQALGGGRHGDNFLWCLGHDESKNIEWMDLRGRIKPPAVMTDKASFKKQLCGYGALCTV